MSRDLLAYLDDLPCGSPCGGGAEYSYLGHFASHEYLDAGHNELDMEQTIESGRIPDIHTGKNYAADAMPASDDVSKQGATPPADPMPSSGGGMGGGSGSVGSALKGAMVGTASDLMSGSGAQDYSGAGEGEATTNVGATFGENLTAQGGIGKALAGLF